MDAPTRGLKCWSCEKITLYKCLTCNLPACNRCTVFEKDEEVTGWQAGVSVGYCKDCQLSQNQEETEKSGEDTNSDNFDRESLSPSPSLDTNSESYNNDDEDDSSKTKCVKKKAGRKAMWSDNALDDFVDIITGSEYYKKKLIFTNTKNQKNGIIYEKILIELKRRCHERNETIDFTIVQMQNKFKKCISECKHAAMTIKTATGIKRFQESKGYGAWFKQLFPLVQSRDSCQPEMAIEPSCSSSNCSTSGNSLNENDEDDEPDMQKTLGVKSFVPLKKKKVPAKYDVGEAIALIKTMVENDPSKELMRFMQEEAERSRKHELEMAKLLFSAGAPNQHPEREELHSWQQYHPSAPNFQHQHHLHVNANNFQHHQSAFQHPTSTMAFVTPTQTYSRMDQSSPDNVGKHYHTL